MDWRPASYSRETDGGLECTLCPIGCVLGEGQIGSCRVRRRSQGRIETATFASSVRHVQPIERKPLYHFRPGSRALTLAAPGCTFACSYCQNYRLSQWGRYPEAVWEAQAVDPSEVVAQAYAQDLHIAFSYSEPVLATELTLAIAPLAAAVGVSLVWKTNGFITESAARDVGRALSAVNVDLKSADDGAHRRLTRAHLTPVLKAIEIWKAAGVWVEISTPIIAGVNDSADQLQALARAVREWGPETPWHLLRVHPDYQMCAIPPTHPETLARACAIARQVGLRHVYVERALGPEGRNTVCPGCGTTVVRRGIWSLEENNLNAGSCRHCGQTIPGHW